MRYKEHIRSIIYKTQPTIPYILATDHEYGRPMQKMGIIQTHDNGPVLDIQEKTAYLISTRMAT
jgi:hypothetical protein